jgi:hypothetical protein
MKRYTETELEKIVRIGLCRIDQIMDRACAELEEIKPKPEAMLKSQMVSCVVGQHFSVSEFQDCRWLDLASAGNIIRI